MKTAEPKTVTVSLGGVVLYTGADAAEIAKARAAVAAEYRATRDERTMAINRRVSRSRRARRGTVD